MVEAQAGLLAFDLDGTIAEQERLVSGLVEEVQCWRELGWKTAIITARWRTPTFLEEFPADAVTRCYGAWIACGREPLQSIFLPSQTASIAIAFTAPELQMMVLSAEACFKTQPEKPSDLPLAEWRPTVPVLKLHAKHPDPAVILELMAYWQTLPDVVVVPERDTACALVARGADKGAALSRIAGGVDVPLAQVIALGDGASDASMLAHSKTFVRVGQHPALQAAVYRVAQPKDVPTFLEKLRLATYK